MPVLKADDRERDQRVIGGDPVRNLWAAVISAAIDDLKAAPRRYAGERWRGGAKRAEARKSQNFFTSPNSTLPWICEMLGLDLESIRARARELQSK